MIIQPQEKPGGTVSTQEFLATSLPKSQVLNLCDNESYNYSSLGYYVSLVAEARGLAVTPSTADLLDVKNQQLFLSRVQQSGLLTQAKKEENDQVQTVHVVFGTCMNTDLAGLSKKMFDLFHVPVLELVVINSANGWAVHSAQVIGKQDLSAEELVLFDQHVNVVKKQSDISIVEADAVKQESKSSEESVKHV